MMSPPRIVPMRFRASLLALAGAAAVVGSQAARAQQPLNLETASEWTNSLGMKFKKIAEGGVMLCEWETRLQDFQAFVRDSGWRWNEATHFKQDGSHPVVNVTLEDAGAFCQWLTKKERAAGRISRHQLYRLPTNREWSLACGLDPVAGDAHRGDSAAGDLRYPWGGQWPPPPSAANLQASEIPGYDDPHRFTAPVGSYTMSPGGFYDLAGNVWEWCEDEERDEGQATLRGGSWIYFRPDILESSHHYPVRPDMRFSTIGFRCALEDKELRARILRKATDAAKVDRFKAPSLGGESEALATVSPPQVGERWSNSLRMQFAPIKDGDDRALLGVHEVTASEFKRFTRETGIEWTPPGFGQESDHAAANVSWDNARKFCAWLTDLERTRGTLGATQAYRLPTDLEWSLAAGLRREQGDTPEARARASDPSYYWGTEWPPPNDSGNYNNPRMDRYEDKHSYTAPVQQTFQAAGSPFMGLAGNVAEWCSDAWSADDDRRVVRGASWLDYQEQRLRVGFRRPLAANREVTYVGFRCLLEL